MATDGGGKLKPKRSQPAQKPYERRKSLYKKVTDTVKDLLSPSWLTDIVSTVKKSPPKQNYPSTLEEDEDEMFMSPPQSPNLVNSYSGPPRIASQLENKLPAPQPKRSRVPVPSISQNNPAFGSSTSHRSGSFSSSQLPLSRYGVNTNKPSTSTNRNVVTRSPIHDNVSHLSSGYSFEQQTNLLNLNEKELQQIKDNLSTSQTKPASDSEDQHSKTMARNTSLKTDGSSQRARIWQNEVCQPVRPIEPVVTDKPSFKASLFGSPVIDTSLLGDDTLNQSSFYPGKTTFGGSSSVRNRSRLNVTAPYQTALPIRKHMTPKLANNSFSAVTSSSARRILESLERMSTPLSDVKKIPMEVPSVSDSLLSFTPSSYRRQSRSFQPSVLSRRSIDVPIRSGPPTSQIRTHSIASISRNRQTVTSTPISNRKVSLTQEDLNVTQEAPKRKEDNGGVSALLPRDNLYETPSSSSWGAGGGKMKRDKTHHYSSKRPEDDDIMEIPSLKADFTLPVSNLPQIHFTATPIVKVDDDMAKCISETNKGELKFSFSSPVHQSQTPVNVESPGSNVKSFTFSSPLKADDKSKDAKSSTVAFTFMSTPSTAPKLKTTSVFGNGGIDFMSNQLSPKTDMNKSNLANFTSKSDSFKSSPVLKSGSVMDILGNGSSPQTLKQGSVMDILGKNSATSPASTLKEGSVMDILNKKEQNTVEPELRKADTVKITTTEGTITGNKESLSSLFSKPSGAWSCDICMVQNNPDKTKCAACETPRPGSKPSVGSITGNKESLSSLFSKQSGAWSCDICMVQNNPDKTKCAACETPRPGSKPSVTQATSLSVLFKKEEGSWDCDVCLVQNKANVTKCISCETSKPGAKNTEGNSNTLSSGIKFGSSGAGTITDSGFKINTVDLNKTNTSACGFKFGSTDSTTPVTTRGFTNSQSSDKVSFATDDKLSDKTTGFSFSSKDTTSSNQKTDTGFTFGNPESSGEQKPESGFTFGNPKASGGEKSETGFSFGIAKSTDEGQAGSGFSFSPPASSDNKTDMAFGQTKTDVNVSSGFSLGAQSNSVFGGNTNSQKGFQFNQPMKTVDNSNSSQTNTNGQLSTGGFVFGASDSKNKIQETNNNNLVKDKSVEIKSGFSFGQSAPSSVGGFNMGSNSVLGDSQQKLPNDFTFGGSTTNTNTGGLGVFSSAPTGNLTNTNNTSFTSSKRTIDDDSDEPKAKKSFVFGASSSTAPNGPFDSKPTAAVQPETKSTVAPVFNFSANPTQQPNNTGFNFGVTTPNVPVFTAVTKPAEKQSDSLFTFGGGGGGNNSQSFGNTSNNFSGAPAAFGSSSFGGNGSTSGSTIGSTQATNAPAFGASSATPAFGASGQTSAFGNSSSFGATNNAGFQFNATPNLSFTGSSGNSTFQFSGKSNESGNATTAQTPQTPAFAFGGPGQAAVAPTTSFTAPSFGTPGQPGSFNIGAGATDRKIKKAVRRKR